MRRGKRIKEQSMDIGDAKDEMNLAEFPLCVLGHRPPSGQKTLQFQDRTWDTQSEQHVTRQLTVTGSDAYGLPTALDDEVLLGLVQLSKQQGFAQRKVPFTRYQLIQLLNWRDETKAYERIETSLNRWTGVTLFYANAWWNKERRSWMDEKFHVLDNVRLYRRRNHARGSERNRSSFVWNEVVFDSFRAGNLKSIDFEFFRDLRNATAKRLYRFLDKRFHHRRRQQFSLKELAWEHIGLGRQYDIAGLKRRLRPGVRELEEKGFVREMTDAERFHKVCAGEWTVTFERGRTKVKPGRTDVLVQQLVERGVSQRVASRTIKHHSRQSITNQVEAFDWLKAKDDPRISRNPPGYLITAIREGYGPPSGFVASRTDKPRPRSAATPSRPKTIERIEAAEREEDIRIRAYWDGLSPEERTEAEEAALAQAGQLNRRLIAKGGSAGHAAHQAALDAYARTMIHSRA